MSTKLSRLWRRQPAGLNVGLVVFAVAGITTIIGVGMLLIAIFGYLRGGGGALTFAATGAACAVPGALVLNTGRGRAGHVVIRARDVFLTVTACWLVAALVSAVPLLLAGDARSYTAAVFEAMSGFTTTGSTIYDEVEPLPATVLLWRSTMQWLGGIGIVVLLVGIAPALGIGSVRALFAEVTGPVKERYTPRIADTARALVRIYLVLTAACMGSYVVTGMGAFDAVNHAMTTISTGGFSTRTASFGFYEQASTRLVAIVFMFLGGVNFGLFILLSMRQRPTRSQRYELGWYVAALAAFSSIVAATLTGFDGERAPGALMDALFNVVSVVTTTGYITVDFDEWNHTARTLMLAFMFVGGSAGSTVGGVKIFRWMMLSASIRAELRRLMHPSAVIIVRVGDRRFTDRDMLTLMTFLSAYFLVFVASAIGVAAVSDLDVVSAVSASAASLALVGPALGQVGAAESYSVVSDAGLAILTLTMLLGRLEVFTVLALLTPAFWRRR